MARDPLKGSSRSEAPPFDRRAFLGKLGQGAAGLAAGAALSSATASNARAATGVRISAGPTDPQARREAARDLRIEMAQMAYDRGVAVHTDNGDEATLPDRIGNYSKGLPHDALGHVDPPAYDALLAALSGGDKGAFEAIPLGLGRKLTNPRAGLAFDLEGPDGPSMVQPPAPGFSSAETAGEMAELYWMSLLRDVPFVEFDKSKPVEEAAADLSEFSDFRGPKPGGSVTAETIFRGVTAGDLNGPYVSQFLLRDIPYGSLTISQRQATAPIGSDYMTRYDDWLDVQNGLPERPYPLDTKARYIRNMRDLAHYVHVDALYEAYLNACLILMGMGAPFDPGNPYSRSATQIGFGTFGGPHILSLVTEAATRALKAVWFQKWYVHRRLRPEMFGGRVHNHLSGAASYPIHLDLLNSAAVDEVVRRHGTWLLPMAFIEGSPTHPAYGAGHATVAGACTTILKAWFDESHVLANPVVANAPGTNLIAWNGSSGLTVGGELDKVAANVAIGRNMAGVHWRSDYLESVRLGEEIAIGILEEQHGTYDEGGHFEVTRLDGTTITIG